MKFLLTFFNPSEYEPFNKQLSGIIWFIRNELEKNVTITRKIMHKQVTNYLQENDSELLKVEIVLNELENVALEIFNHEYSIYNNTLNSLECGAIKVRSNLFNEEYLYDLIHTIFFDIMHNSYISLSSFNKDNTKPIYRNIRTLYSELEKEYDRRKKEEKIELTTNNDI